MSLEEGRDRLFTVPPERFVEEREALARRLRADGDRDAAKEVKALRRPSLGVWTINRLARERKDDVRALLDAADRLQQGKAEAAGEVREALNRLVRDAERLLEEDGRRGTDSTLRTIASTLQAAAGADRDALERGRLTEELEPGGFEAMAGLAGSAPPPRRERATSASQTDGAPGQRQRRARGQSPHALKTAPPSRRLEPKRRDTRRIEEALAAVKRARERERELRREADEAERAARRAHEAADRAAKELERAERRLQAARGR